MSVKSIVTAEQLLANGWKSQNDQTIPFTKRIGYTKGAGYMVLQASGSEGGLCFALRLPGKSLVHLTITSIWELNAFEAMILSYEPNF